MGLVKKPDVFIRFLPQEPVTLFRYEPREHVEKRMAAAAERAKRPCDCPICDVIKKRKGKKPDAK